MKRHASKKRKSFSTNGTGTTRYSNQKINMTSLVAQTVKRLPTIWKTWVQSLGWEDPLEEEIATYTSTLSWKIPWMEDGILHGVAQSQTRLSDATFTFFLAHHTY